MRGGKNILLIVAGAVGLAVLGLAGFLLYRGVSRFGSVERTLREAVSELKDYYARDPFPSPGNIDREETNVVVLTEWYDTLLGDLSRGQIEPVEKSPSKFMTTYGKTKNALLKRGGSAVPAGFAFGFDRYAVSGVPPAPDDVPRLTQQLTIVESVCGVLFDAGVSELVSVRREEFEDTLVSAGSGPRPSGRFSAPSEPERKGGTLRQPGVIGPRDLYATFHFEFELAAHEKNLLDALNRLARHPLFIVVTDVEIAKVRGGTGGREEAAEPAGREPGLVSSGEGRARAAGSRRERLMYGEELERPLRVKLALDVYQFRRAG